MNPPKSTWLDAEAVKRVATALGGQNTGADIEDCKISDVKHVVELLARVLVLEDVAPRFVASLLDTFLPHFLKQSNRAVLAQSLQCRADADGIGDEWEALVKAVKANSGIVPAMVKFTQASERVDEETAIYQVAGELKKDLESVKRAMRRQRKKK